MTGDIWPGGRRLALSLVVNVEEGAELTVADGDRGPDPVDELGVAPRRPIRNYGNESNYRYGLVRGAPRILDLLARHAMPATFAAAARSLERSPDLARRIAADGHEACAHGWRWVHQHRMDEAEERDFIERAARSIEKTVGTRPLGWLSRYLPTANTRRLLTETGFLYHMDDYSDDRPFWDTDSGAPILVMPYAIDSNDMKMWAAPAYTPEQWYRYAVDSFDLLYREGRCEPRMMSLGLHLRIIGRPGRFVWLQRFLDHVRRHPGVWVARRADIARHWAGLHPPPGQAGDGQG